MLAVLESSTHLKCLVCFIKEHSLTINLINGFQFFQICKMRGNVFSPILTTNNLTKSVSFVPDDEEDLDTPPVVITKVDSIDSTQSNFLLVNNRRAVENGRKGTLNKDRFNFNGIKDELHKTAENQESLIDILPNLNKPDYEFPLIDCGCCEVYWSPYFAKIIKLLLGINLKCRSKKGTPYYKIKAPRINNKLRKWMKESAAAARRKSINASRVIEREWMQIRPNLRWRQQDPHYLEKLEMEREIKRLRQALQDTTMEDGIETQQEGEASSSKHPLSNYHHQYMYPTHQDYI